MKIRFGEIRRDWVRLRGGLRFKNMVEPTNTMPYFVL